MSKIDQLLVEKYRPTSLDDYIFVNDSLKDTCSKWKESGSFPNIMFSGPAGTGKTTLARILTNEVGLDSNDVRIINASRLKVSEIDDVLVPWMRRVSMNSFKVVILEEMDRLSKQHAQKSLRYVIEEYSDNVRFIATCNYPNQIIPSLHSRFQHFHIDAMDYDGVLDLVVNILEDEGRGFEEPEDVMSHVDFYQPDIRKILNSIDQNTASDGSVKPLQDGVLASDVDDWDLMWDSSEEIDVELALELAANIDQSNFESFYEAMERNSSKLPDEGRGIVLLSRYLDRAQTSANQLLHMRAALYHIFLFSNEGE